MNYIKPKKYLGQHFLTDKNIAEKIVAALSVETTPAVLEIGPGKGILTEILLRRTEINLHVIEIDKECSNLLNKNFEKLHGKIIENDFLKVNLSELFNTKFNIIGNFPYNISSQILFKILGNKNLIPETVCMVQKEVADRICSPPGNKTYGILSVLLQAYYKIDYLFTVKPTVFNPPPKVNSAVIRLTRNENYNLACDEALFVKVVKTAFNQRRKTMRNSLKNLTGQIINDPIFTLRPEQLNYEQFVFITNLISSIGK